MSSKRFSKRPRAGLRQRRRLEVQRLETRRLMAGDVVSGDRPLGATEFDTAEFFLGRVGVTPVFLNSDGTADTKTQHWTEGEIDEVLGRIDEGLSWWEDTLDNLQTGHSLEFVIDTTYATSPVDIPNEPIDRNSNLYLTHVENFLSEVGANQSSSTNDDMFAFNDAQRAKLDVDWSFTIFVVDSSDDADGLFPETSQFRGAFALPGGLYMVLPSERPVRTIAHEVGHLFWGFDEYANSDSYYAQRGYYNSPNTNSVVNNPDPSFVQQDSIMASNTPMLDAFLDNTTAASTLAVIGWQDSDGDGIFDVLDVPLSLSGNGYWDPVQRLYHFDGYASAETLINLNSAGPQSDITTNRVDRFQARIDDGPWQDLLTPQSYTATLSVSVPIPDDFDQVTFRVVDDTVGVTSEEVVGTAVTPAVSATSYGGYAFFDANGDGVRSLDESLLNGIDVSILDVDGNALNTGFFDASAGPIETDLTTTQGMTFTGSGTRIASGVQVLPEDDAGVPHRIYIYDENFDRYTDRLTRDAALEVALEVPTGQIEVDVVGLRDVSYARVEAYDVNGVMIDRVTTDLRNDVDGVLSLNEQQTLRLVDSQARIASVRVFGHAETWVGVTGVRHGADSSLVTDAGGVVSLDGLADGSYLVRATPESVIHEFEDSIVTVVAGQVVGGLTPIVASRVDSTRYNAGNPEDVNGDLEVTALDALQIINDINLNQSRDLTFAEQGGPDIDVNNDGRVSAVDALRVINRLNELDSPNAASEPQPDSLVDHQQVFAAGDWGDESDDQPGISTADAAGDSPKLV
ncbi:MAG: dockerin type I domain-containing protein [Planctomycetota bacterium]